MEWNNGDGYRLTDDPNAIDIDRLTALLHGTYWAFDRPREVIKKSVAASLPLSLIAPDGTFAGFGRAVTDKATFAWIADVIIDPAHRGKGLGKWLTATLVAHPALAGSLQILRTKDAHGLYTRLGFSEIPFMQRGARLFSDGD